MRTIDQTILFVFFTGLVFFPPGIAQSNQQEPVTQDLSRGATFKVTVAPDLGEFTFKVIPQVEKADQHGNPRSTIQEIQVFRGNGAVPSQTLEDCEWEGMEPPPRGAEWFRSQDMNFDNYKDIYVLTNWGATGYESGCVWLYDPPSGKFVFSQEFSNLGTFTLHPETETITTSGNGGMAGAVFGAGKYVVENNRPVEIMNVTQEWDLARKQFHCIVKRRRPQEAEWTTVRDLWAPPDKNEDGPCDPSNPFRDIGARSSP